jgi:ribonuclease J
MRFRIHRAASQVGGNCIEVWADGRSILLDLGLPLAAERASPNLLPSLNGIASGDTGDLLAVVLSHPHQDHYGLLNCANPNLPVYMGAGAERLLDAASVFTSSAHISQRTIAYQASLPFQVGPFSITALPVDHSAYDAYALLIQADGKRLLYSGDFRLHGRKGRLMESMLQRPPKDVDVLLMEGTVVGREDAESRVTESELELRIASSLKQSKGLALANFSAQNIDRLVTFFRAAVRSGRTLVVDVYTAHILDKLGRTSLPSAQHPSVRVFLPLRQKMKIVREGRFDLVEPFRDRRIFAPQINANPRRWLCLFRTSMAVDFEAMPCLNGATLIYSLWPGYLKRDGGELLRWAEKHGVHFEIHHTSGHAFLSDLVRFAGSISPKRLVPIHTSRPEQYRGLFENVSIVKDGVWSEV